MPRSKGRWVAIAAGVAVAAVVVAALLSWMDLLTRYHLERLRRDPALLERLILEAEGSVEFAAVRRYLETRAGKEACCELYARNVLLGADWVVRGSRQVSPQGGMSASDPFIAGAVLNQGDQVFVAFRFLSGSSSSGATVVALPDGPPPATGALRRLAASLRGEKFTSERYPGFEITLLRGDEACERVGYWFGFGENGELGPRGVVDPDRYVTAGDRRGLQELTALLVEPRTTIADPPGE